MKTFLKPIDYWNDLGQTSYFRSRDYINAYLDEFFGAMKNRALLDIIDPHGGKITYLKHRSDPTLTEQYRRFVDMSSSIVKDAILALSNITAGELQALALYAKELWIKTCRLLDYQYLDALNERMAMLHAGDITVSQFWKFVSEEI